MHHRPNILYVVHRLPYPPDKGDRIRNFHVLRFLSRRAAVHLACLADEPIGDESLAELAGYCERLAVVRLTPALRAVRVARSVVRGGTATEGAFDSPKLRQLLRTWAAQTDFHATVASASSVAPYLRLDELRHAPAIVDLVDVDSQKWFDYAAASTGLRAWIYGAEGRRLRRLEADLPAWARAVTLVSGAEADLYRRACSVRPSIVHAVHNGVDLEYFRPIDAKVTRHNARPVCVFVGALDYRPNVDGANWFCRHVLPLIRVARPDAKVCLVGRKPAPAVQQLAELPGVELVGQVPDVRPYVASATVAVVPLRIARGLQNKVLEAMAMGKAVVASPQALAGVKVEPGVHLRAAESPAEWAEAVLRLFDDAPLRQQLGSAARAFVELHHDWDRCLSPFAELLGLPDTDSAERGAELAEHDNQPSSVGTEYSEPSSQSTTPHTEQTTISSY
jgi:sugar transferase (PEP-CTERM/EpsH1 system associated)